MSTIATYQPIGTQADTLTVSLNGNILSTNAQEVRAELTKALSAPGSAEGTLAVFELNLTRAQMIDSVGLNLLVWLLKAVRGRGARLRLIVTGDHVLRTLQFTRLDQQAEVVTKTV